MVSPLRPGLSYVGRLSIYLFTLIILVAPAVAQNRKPTEYEVKAAYLYNFGKFIKWPPPASRDSFPICILGDDPFGRAIDGIVAGESLEGRPLSVLRVSSTAEAQKCRIVFVSRSEQGRVGAITASLERHPVLTVSDIPEFTAYGGIIQFTMQGDRVRFSVNLDAASAAGLTLSSELLKVAVRVKR